MTAGPGVRKAGGGGRECRYLVVKGREKWGSGWREMWSREGLFFR